MSLILLVSALVAQNPYGRITGRVSDATGAMVSGAAVRLVNIDTNVATETTSNAE